MDIGILEFVTLIVVGVFIYFGMTYLSDKFFRYKMQIIIKESFQLIRGS